LCFCCACLRLVYPMLPVSLDISYVIALSVFSNVLLHEVRSQSKDWKAREDKQFLLLIRHSLCYAYIQ
jgi:hypothetical protein